MNRYFLLRHGESVPNQRGVILSDPEEGKKEEHALTPRGEKQVVASIAAAKDGGSLGADAVIWSSPFSRTRRTAEIAREGLGVGEAIVFDDRLRERWFGDWEREGNGNYESVWNDDARDPEHRIAHVESVADVMRRISALMDDLGRRYDGRRILIVSHGDVLQILQAVSEGRSPAEHRQIPPLATAEIREMHWRPGSARHGRMEI